MTERSIDVLICGAGPVGLAAAIELGSRGIRCLVVERNDRVGRSPRAKTTNVRTREHLRRWGIAEALRAASPIPADYPSNIVFATRMNGHLLTRIENALDCDPAKSNLYSESSQWVPQYVLEEVLRRYAVTLPGVEIAFDTELTSVDERSDHVICKARRGGDEWTLESAYLIGADGARSFVREAIGVRMEGQGAFSRNYNIIFRSKDLAARNVHGPAIMYWLINEDAPSILGPMDDGALWTFSVAKLGDGVDPSAGDAVQLIRKSTGLADLDVEVVATDPWVAHRLVADRYNSRRVYLAGDACHLHPPFGGFGMNMGIGDAVDLGWKLAATLQGWGGPQLLESYAIERRPVHERTIAEAILNYNSVGATLVRPGLEEPGLIGEATRREVGDFLAAAKIREFKTLGVVLGMRYQGSPVIIDDGSAPPPEDARLYIPSAHPGCLAPHLWLRDGSSLYDHFGAGLTLLVTSGDSRDARAAVLAADALNAPLTILAPEEARLPARYQARFALIRPDQHVAWRGDRIPEDARLWLTQIVGREEQQDTSGADRIVEEALS